jgi:hypothetical protein
MVLNLNTGQAKIDGAVSEAARWIAEAVLGSGKDRPTGDGDASAGRGGITTPARVPATPAINELEGFGLAAGGGEDLQPSGGPPPQSRLQKLGDPSGIRSQTKK